LNFSSSAPPSRGAIAASAQDLSEAEFRELDELLAGVPEPLEPLDAVMLDGFLCGVIVQPRLPDADEWLPFVFDAGGHRWGEAEPGAEQLRARTLILRRHAALNRSIAEFGGFDPFVLEPLPADELGGAAPATESSVPAAVAVGAADAWPAAAERTGSGHPVADMLSPWVAGFEQALQLLPGLAELADPEVDAAIAEVFRFLPGVAGSQTVSLDAAIGAVVAEVANLYDITAPLRYKVESLRRDSPKVGRNDPCPCGSGRKFKQCHGAAAASPR
jgi:uncharacterized protein